MLKGDGMFNCLWKYTGNTRDGKSEIWINIVFGFVNLVNKKTGEVVEEV